MVKNGQQLSTPAKTVKKGQKRSKNGFKKEGKNRQTRSKKIKTVNNGPQQSIRSKMAKNSQNPVKNGQERKRRKAVNNGQQRSVWSKMVKMFFFNGQKWSKTVKTVNAVYMVKNS